MKKESKIYFYKMTVDSGAAPRVQRNLLSLAICKPVIRRTAKEGDLVFAFEANRFKRDKPHTDNCLVYIAEVTKKLTDGDYFKRREYWTREDCIYRWKAGRYRWLKGAKYHGKGKQLKHDLGKPPHYKNANVLLSTNFRYFGGNGTPDYKKAQPSFARFIKKLSQGHKVIHAQKALFKEFQRIKEKAWKQPKMKLGEPSRKPHPGESHCSQC